MSVGLDHPEVMRFLARLDTAAAVLPAGRREELVGELREHLKDALSVGAGDEAAVRQALDRLGDPADIVAAEASGGVPGAAGPGQAGVLGEQFAPEQQVSPGHRVSPWGGLELAAVLLLTAGFVVLPVVGPLIGIVLVWVSMRWTRREKVVATVLTLLPPMAIVLAIVGLGPVHSEFTESVEHLTPESPVVSTAPVVVP